MARKMQKLNVLQCLFDHFHCKGGVHIMGKICPRSDPDIAHMKYSIDPQKLIHNTFKSYVIDSIFGPNFASEHTSPKLLVCCNQKVYQVKKYRRKGQLAGDPHPSSHWPIAESHKAGAPSDTSCYCGPYWWYFIQHSWGTGQSNGFWSTGYCLPNEH